MDEFVDRLRMAQELDAEAQGNGVDPVIKAMYDKMRKWSKGGE